MFFKNVSLKKIRNGNHYKAKVNKTNSPILKPFKSQVWISILLKSKEKIIGN